MLKLLLIFLLSFPFVFIAELLIIKKLIERGEKNMEKIKYGKAGKKRTIKITKGKRFFIIWV